jgi:hypothetical protein
MKKERQNHWLNIPQRGEEQLETRSQLYEEEETESLAKVSQREEEQLRTRPELYEGGETESFKMSEKMRNSWRPGCNSMNKPRIVVFKTCKENRNS